MAMFALPAELLGAALMVGHAVPSRAARVAVRARREKSLSVCQMS